MPRPRRISPKSLIALVLVTLGLITARYLVQQSQDIRQKAATLIHNLPQLTNASNYQTITTIDPGNSGQAVHPDIIYRPQGWNGYPYWMTAMAYPNSDDRWEDPSIYASQNGITWLDPGNNPIVPSINTDTHVYSDADSLIVNNTLYVYYRLSQRNNNQTTMYRVSSTNGTSWTSPQATNITQTGGTFASPTIVYDSGTYYLYYVNTLTNNGSMNPNAQVHRRTSSNGINWSSPTNLFTFPYAWHLDVIKYQDHHLMLLVERLPIGNSKLHYLTSEDGANWTNVGRILSPSETGWDSSNLYRSTFIIDGSRFRVWYSAFQDSNVHIGYTEDNNWSYSTISNATPSCSSWTDVHINTCNSFSKFDSHHQDCNTNNAQVILPLAGTNNPTSMKFYNPTNYSTYCSSLSGNEAGWSLVEPFLPTKNWALSQGPGDNKVCVQLKNGNGWGTPCGAGIHSTAPAGPTPTPPPTPTHTPPPPTNTPKPPTPTNPPTPTPTKKPTPTPTNKPTSTPTPTQPPPPSPTPGTAACNQTCSSDADCDTGLFCSPINLCRNLSCPFDTTCTCSPTPSVPPTNTPIPPSPTPNPSDLDGDSDTDIFDYYLLLLQFPSRSIFIFNQFIQNF